jgi:flagellar FliL protein
MAEAVAQASSQGKKRSMAKMLLLGVNLLLFLSGAAFFLLTKFGVVNKPVASESAEHSAQLAEDKKDTPAEKDTAKQHAKAPAKAEAKAEAFHGELVAVPMQPLVVNLSGDNGRRYIRLVMQLQVRGEKAKADLEKHLGPVRDRLIFLLSSKAFEDISTVQGKYQLQAEIGRNINEVLEDTLVEKVYFTDFVVQ